MTRAAADRYAKREAELQARLKEKDRLGPSAYQRKLQAERKAQQDLRNQAYPPVDSDEELARELQSAEIEE